MRYIVLGIILVIILWALIGEYAARKANEYYECYCKMFFRGMAKDSKCAGLDTEFCKHCRYKKHYEKEII